MKKVSVVLVLLLVSMVTYGESYWTYEGAGNVLYADPTNLNIAIGAYDTYGYKLYVNGSTKLNGPLSQTQNVYLALGSGTKVGIGTTNPHNKLEIGNAFSFHDANDEVIGLGYAPGYGDLNSGEYAAELRLDPQGGILSLGVATQTNGIPSTFLAVTKDGNVGIGTTSPESNLEVAENAEDRPAIILSDNTGGDTDYWIGIDNDNAGDDDDKLQIGKGLTPGTNPYFTLDENGNVGIGTTSPASYKLDVNGHIRTKEITVETGWSDFIFEDNYQLMPLKELEQHIKVNKSLPGIPTEKEVTENGIELGEMQAKLLEKVEELTLYVIELKKENETLKKRIDVLEN